MKVSLVNVMHKISMLNTKPYCRKSYEKNKTFG